MNSLLPVLEKVQAVVWGPPTLLLLLATGVYFTIRLQGLQITKLGLAIRYIFIVICTMTGIVAFPNLIGLLGLSSVVIKETRDYFAELKPQR
ncbi:MAG TPA: hypothetical protein H9858_03380 [Candidatus Blautia stercoravium]|nr:hypothetical protein [Candidatus Blautia stercoravium]